MHYLVAPRLSKISSIKFHIFLCLLSSDLWSGNFFVSFLLFSSDLWLGTFFFFLLFLKCVSSSIVSDSSFLGDPTVPFSEGKDGNSHPRSRFMVIWGLGSKGLQNSRTWRMPGCWFGQQLRDKGNVPHYFHDMHVTMMI